MPASCCINQANKDSRILLISNENIAWSTQLAISILQRPIEPLAVQVVI
jgi:hypothetical protein